MNVDDDDAAVGALASSEAWAESAVESVEDIDGTGNISTQLALAQIAAQVAQTYATQALVQVGFGILDALTKSGE